jgi:nucleoside-diphosphate-sugar epimerase
VARVLIVGCGCRGRELARELAAAGHAVRGTTRASARLGEIEATGAEAVLADPDRLGTIMAQLHGVSLLCWLLGTADPEAAPALHGPRLRTLLERLVDTPVRGIVYEAAGSVDAELLTSGAAAVRQASATWSMPGEVVEADLNDFQSWLGATTAAVERLLSQQST